MRKFLMAACAIAALAPTAAISESWTLMSHKHWEVSYISTDDLVYCSARNMGDGMMFAINVGAGGVSVFVYDSRRDWNASFDALVKVKVDGRSPWTVSDVVANGEAISFDLVGDKGAAFLREIEFGNRVSVDYKEIDEDVSRFDSDLWFSLSGSRAALFALNECMKRL